MSIENKMDLLEGIYRIYGEFAGGLDSACHKYCAHCCTSDVTITTVEGYYLIHHLDPVQRGNVQRMIEIEATKTHFRPQLTTNRIAELCRQGQSVPVEDHSADNRKCPFLTQAACPLYRLRPFGCRCFISKFPCRDSGMAEVDEYVLSVTTVFLQTIEHLDANGCSGNLSDVLLCLLSAENRHAYLKDQLDCRSAGLVANTPLTVLMVPPDHRNDLKPILAALNSL